MTRAFEDKPATRERVPVLMGLVGPSGGGKTMSALRVASGIQQVTGGEIGYIDTESRRALHYADQFSFLHLDFKPPFSPIDYLAAVEHFVKKGVKVLVIDSLSHEHEGQGGVLEWHAEEVERIKKAWSVSGDKANMPAWQEPKAARRKLINAILQLGINGVFCFRAKEKVKLGGGKVTQMGWEPIAGTEFIYEWTVQALLPPGAQGVPDWNPDGPGAKAMVKRPAHLAHIFPNGEQLSEKTGKELAEWSLGDEKPSPPATPDAEEEGSDALADALSELMACEDKAELEAAVKGIGKRKKWTKAENKRLQDAWLKRVEQLEARSSIGVRE